MPRARTWTSTWAAAAGACALLAVQASAANLVQVRVGSHADFTRVVLETDAPVRYELTRSDTGELRVRLFASASPRRVASKSPVLREVVVESDAAGAIARLALKKRAVVDVKEMVLDKPPRIVLDLRARAPGAPETDPGLAKAEPAPAPAPRAATPEAARGGSPAREPTRAAEAERETPAPRGEPERGEAPAPRDPEPSETGLETGPSAEPAADPEAVAEAGSGASPPARDEESAREAAAQAELDRLAGIAPRDEAEPAPEEAPAAAPPEPLEPESAPSDFGAAAEAREEADELEVASSRGRDLPAPTGGLSFLPAPLDDPLVLGVVSGLLVLVAVLALLRRRSARAAGAESLASPFASTEPYAWAGAGATAQAGAQPPSAASDAEMGPLFASATAQSAPAEAAPAAGGGSLFDVAEPEAAGPDDYEPEGAPYADPGIEAAPSAATSYKADSLEGDDMRVIEELERRLAHLETRLEEVVDAKERLERHVAAQTEELRVQRAAIARTQRVLRTVVKPDDLATEPAPKV